MFRFDTFDPATSDGAGSAGSRLAVVALVVLDRARRRALLIALCCLLGLAGAVVVSVGLSPSYTATAELLVDPNDLNLVENDLTRRPEAADSGATMAETQVKILTSDSVLSRVVDALHLDGLPEFAHRPSWRRGGWLEDAMVALGAATREGDDDPRAAAVNALRSSIAVRRTERTFVIDIAAKTSSPDLSAKIANAVAEAFLAKKSSMRVRTARRAASEFSANLDTLRAAVSKADAAVVAYKAAHRLIGGTGGTVTDQQISETTAALDKAREVSAQAKARYHQAMATRGPDADATLPEIVQSPELRALRAELEALNRQKAEMAGRLGPRHPDLIDLSAKIAQARLALAAQTGSLLASLKREYDRALAAEASLSSELDRLRQEGSANAAANVSLRQLQDDLDAKRSVYEAMLRRAGDVGEQGRIDSTNAQLISAADPPRKRSFPPSPSLLLPAGLMAGLAFGILLAVLLPFPLAGPIEAGAAGRAAGGIAAATRFRAEAGGRQLGR